MPRRAAPCDRAAVEAALTPALRAALLELAELLNVWDWRFSPLAAPFEHAGVVLAAVELVRRGVAEKDAVAAASIELGISPETSRSRGRRWPRDSRSLCTPTAASGGATFQVGGKPAPEKRP